jgi:DNA (cytosine-5)-methyltransferase 1
LNVACKFPLKTKRSWEALRNRILCIAGLGQAVGTVDDARRVASRMGEVSRPQHESRDLNSSLSTLGKLYCHEKSPACSECPIYRFCEHGRKKAKEQTETGVAFIDLFAGAGGLSVGLESAGFRPTCALDNDSSALQTYAFNRPFMTKRQVIHASIEHDTVIKSLPSAPLVVGGPPCQGFSNANRQRLSDDPRNQLYRRFLSALDRSEAQIALMENVPLMMSGLHKLQRDFVDHGFTCAAVKLNALDFGAPQNRDRVFVFSLRTLDQEKFTRIFDFFHDHLLNEKVASPTFSLADAIDDLPALEAKNIRNRTDLENDLFGYTVSSHPKITTPYSEWVNANVIPQFLFNHRTKYNNQRDIEIYGRLAPGEDSSAQSIRDINPYKKRDGIFKDKFYKLEPDKPCKTITAHMYYDCHMYIHPNQARGLTPREAARVQGFNDNYLFLGYPNEWYRQIGNSVSPLVGRAVGRAIRATIEEFGII